MMEGMKRAAMDMPGGHLRKDQVDRLSEVLDLEAAKREYASAPSDQRQKMHWKTHILQATSR